MDINPLENILDQLAEILRSTEEEMKNPSDKKPPLDLLKKVEELERQVELFQRMHQYLLSSSKADQTKIKEIVKNVQPGTLLKDRIVLDRLKQIKAEVDKIRDMFHDAAQEAKKGGAHKPKTPDQRKKKFRGLGGGDKWQKL